MALLGAGRRAPGDPGVGQTHTRQLPDSLNTAFTDLHNASTVLQSPGGALCTLTLYHSHYTTLLYEASGNVTVHNTSLRTMPGNYLIPGWRSQFAVFPVLARPVPLFITCSICSQTLSSCPIKAKFVQRYFQLLTEIPSPFVPITGISSTNSSVACTLSSTPRTHIANSAISVLSYLHQLQ